MKRKSPNQPDEELESRDGQVSTRHRRIAFYGGSFDPVHLAHEAIARELPSLFELDELVFIPAFQAPHKRDRKPTSPFHRVAMLALATQEIETVSISTIELDAPEKPYSVETLPKLKATFPEAEIFFVIGADSWRDITTWREWEKVLTMVSIIVIHRPNCEMGTSHVTEEIRRRVVDLRGSTKLPPSESNRIYFTDAVSLDISATEIRQMIREGNLLWRELVSPEVAQYIVKQKLYLD